MLPFRGSWNSEHRVEQTSNLHKRFLLRAVDDPRILNLLTQKKKYTSLEIRIEMLQVILLNNLTQKPIVLFPIFRKNF